jgi:pyrrolidone-carboxylate peptidase
MKLRPREKSPVSKVSTKESKPVHKASRKSGRELEVLLTGFGKFAGVEHNPTQTLVQHFINSKKKMSTWTGVNVHMHILEVSVEGCDAALYNRDDVGTSTEGKDVVIHLGVNYRGEAIQLEQVAYNNMSFRVPDQKGFQPENEKIFSDRKWDAGLRSGFDLEQVKQNTAQKLKLTKKREQLVLSSDPGR